MGTPSSKPSRGALVVPLDWLDALVELGAALPRTKTDREFVEVSVDRVSRVLSECAVGVRFTSQAASAPSISWMAPESVSVERSAHASRMFPSTFDEYVQLAPDGNLGLHVAHARRALLPSERAFAERARRVLEEAGTQKRAELKRLDDIEELERQVVQSEKLASVGRMIAGVAHELSNPLTAILTYAGALQKSLHERAEHGEPVSADLRSVQRVLTSAQRISTFSRALVGYAKPASSVAASTSLELVIRQALTFCEHEFIDRQIEVLYTPSEPAEVLAVANQLTQVFVNLFTNAAHAMQERGGTLEIRSTANESTGIAQVEVRDSGTGIPEALLTRIFEPFFTTKLGDQGTGLGLSIVRDTMKHLGGRVEVSSKLNQGSVFRLELPLAPARRPRAPRARE